MNYSNIKQRDLKTQSIIIHREDHYIIKGVTIGSYKMLCIYMLNKCSQYI